MALLRLDPENAAASVALRIQLIEQSKAYIREVVKRYDGLRQFEDELERLGVAAAVIVLTEPTAH